MMFWLPKSLRIEIRSRALDEARWLLRDHGEEAEAILAAKSRQSNLNFERRLRYKLAAIELRKLRVRSRPGRALVVYQPGQFSLSRLLRRFRRGRTEDRG